MTDKFNGLRTNNTPNKPKRVELITVQKNSSGIKEIQHEVDKSLPDEE